MVCDIPTSKCIPGSKCGAEDANATPIVPNMLIVLDRSCSMRTQVAGTPKWTLAVNAIKAMTTKFNGQIRFGLTMFPDTTGQQCTQDAIPIPVGPGKEAPISALLTSALATNDPNYPDGPCVTNIDTAMQQAATEPAFNDTTRSSFVLLLSDGAQAGCNAAGGDNGTLQIITNLFQQRKVATFVVGFGGAVDAQQLDAFAVAGGVPSSDPSAKFYKAENQQSLEAALNTIAKRTLGCEMTLGKTPPDPTKVYVFFDNTRQVARDGSHATGWDYDATTNKVTFYGASCDELKAGTVTDVDVVFGCAEATPR
jgi:hypothetical protein